METSATKVTLTKRQIALIFKDYIGQSVLMWNQNNNGESGSRTFTLARVGIEECSGCFNEDDDYIHAKHMYSVDRFVLKLKRLENLTETDLIEIIRIANPSLQDTHIIIKSTNRPKSYDPNLSCVYGGMNDDPGNYFAINTQKLTNPFTEKYLLMCGYAVPLFFGVGHPLNGKTAFDLGLAFENSIENG